MSSNDKQAAIIKSVDESEVDKRLRSAMCNHFIEKKKHCAAYNAAVFVFEEFRRNLVKDYRYEPVQAGAFLNCFIQGNKNIGLPIYQKETLVESFSCDLDCVSDYSEVWKEYADNASGYYAQLERGYFENDKAIELTQKCNIPQAINDFIYRQGLLAKVLKEKLDISTACRYILIGYQYGIRFERAQREHRSEPDFLLPTASKNKIYCNRKRKKHTFADNGTQSFVPFEPLSPCALCNGEADIAMSSNKLGRGKIDVKIRCCCCGVNMSSKDICADVLPALMKGGKATRRIEPIAALVRAWNCRGEAQA